MNTLSSIETSRFEDPQIMADEVRMREDVALLVIVAIPWIRLQIARRTGEGGISALDIRGAWVDFRELINFIFLRRGALDRRWVIGALSQQLRDDGRLSYSFVLVIFKNIVEVQKWLDYLVHIFRVVNASWVKWKTEGYWHYFEDILSARNKHSGLVDHLSAETALSPLEHITE